MAIPVRPKEILLSLIPFVGVPLALWAWCLRRARESWQDTQEQLEALASGSYCVFGPPNFEEADWQDLHERAHFADKRRDFWDSGQEWRRERSLSVRVHEAAAVRNIELTCLTPF